MVLTINKDGILLDPNKSMAIANRIIDRTRSLASLLEM
jgi:hypothetical protein